MDFEQFSNILYQLNNIIKMDFICLIYQMGKVGSSTIYNSLKAVLDEDKLISLHFLSERFKNRAKDNPKYSFHLKQITKVEKLILKYPNQRIKIISLARDPISRNISDLFENPHNYILTGQSIDEMNVDDIILTFKKTNSIAFDYTKNWIDKEFINYTGIDIYRYTFNTDKGYSIISESNYDLLLLRTEDISACLKMALKEFLGITLDNLILSNQSKTKSTFHLYKKLLNSIQFESDELDEIYSSKYARHFYSDMQIAEFKERWSNLNPLRKNRKLL